MTGAVTVRGGSASISAELRQLSAFATTLDRAAGQLTAAIATIGRSLYDPALIEAAVLDPVGAARVIALAGLSLAGAGITLAVCEALAASLRAAVLSYRAADELDRRSRPLLRAAQRLPRTVAALGRPRGWRPEQLIGALTDDPELGAVAVQLLTLAGTAALPLPGATVLLARVLAVPYRDGTAAVTARAELATDDRSGPPRGTADLMRSLALRDRDDDGGGAVDIRILDGPGPRRVILDITGTTRWNLNPLRRTPQASDLATNLRAIGNESSVFERGVVQALQLAGVAPGEPIMLVGHSQGGMVAARLASELSSGNRFTVTQLVTAGAPIGLASVPASVSVLSLENRGDLVPQLDGADNPDRPNWITVRTDHGSPTVLAKHGLQAYLAGAADLDRSRDPSLLSWRAASRPFFDATGVRTQVFQIRRAD